MTIIIADSGATKVDWRIISEGGEIKAIRSGGLSPVYMSEDDIKSIISDSLVKEIEGSVDHIFFYGAGVVGVEAKDKLKSCFTAFFPDAQIDVESDLLAASRALCGNNAGIACIIGTGSNSCFYDGENIVNNVKAGGFILGDEASGAYFGKRLLSDYIKGIMPVAIEKEFVKRYKLDYPQIVQKVYKDEQPSKFLASFAPFLSDFIHHPYINALIRSGFDEFLMRNAAQYEYRRYPVNFVGSIAFNFKEALEKSVVKCNMRMGTIIQSPIDSLVSFHTSKQQAKSPASILDRSIKTIMAETRIDEYGKAKDLLMRYGSVKKAIENFK